MNWTKVFLDPPVKVHWVVRADRRIEVPSFVPGPHYADNFAKQWAAFRSTQLDSVNGTHISRDFLERVMAQPPECLSGKTVLEVGAGAGRFTEHFVQHAALVVAIDLSEAILVNTALGAENLIAAQADLLHLPRMAFRFDLVFCRGVLQHTPDTARAISCLHDWVQPDGLVVFDIFRRGWLSALGPKMLWRRIIPRLFTFESCAAFLDRHAERLLRVRWRLMPWLNGCGRHVLNYALPLSDYQGVLSLSPEQLVEWAKLDTLDAMFAKYDNSMSCDEVLRAIERIGCQDHLF